MRRSSELEFSPQAHQPVLLAEALEYLVIKEGGLYVDVTFGAGGHTRAILEANDSCRVIAFDWDAKALEENSAALKQEFGDRLITIWSNFAQLGQQLKKRSLGPVDGILADFGTSRTQLKGSLSFATSAPLDMRMSSSHYVITAAHIVAQASEKELATIFWDFGEERYARQIARAIVEARSKKRIRTTAELADIVKYAVPPVAGNAARRIHPATRVFQALRIVVNHELDNITAFLHQAPEQLVAGGRLVCISFHSLEDRLVKTFFREQASVGVAPCSALRAVNKKVVIAGTDELQSNPASRSAKLRAAEKI